MVSVVGLAGSLPGRFSGCFARCVRGGAAFGVGLLWARFFVQKI